MPSATLSGPEAGHTEKVWASLLTNTEYLTGLLTLHHSLQQSNTAYSFVALVTESLPQHAYDALEARGIPTHRVPHLLPSQDRQYKDPRFRETWTKLTVFSLTNYDRVVLLDSDMLVTRNMDELMDIPLDTPSASTPSHMDDPDRLDSSSSSSFSSSNTPNGNRVLAAGLACTCNPMKRPHYPSSWKPANCGFTYQRASSYSTSVTPGPLSRLNSGLLVVRPSQSTYAEILERMDSPDTEHMAFPDQDLLADLFEGRWVPLPYVYNALKTLRWKGVHDTLWRDDEVKNVHYILNPKPWEEEEEFEKSGAVTDETHRWWFEANKRRKLEEKTKGIDDGH